MWISALASVIAALVSSAITIPQDARDHWAVFSMLEGAWEGTIDGALGTGTGVRTYEYILDDNFVLLKHASVRPPQPKSPTGDHHRELGVFSFDRNRGKIIYREFIVEGYVNTYVCDVTAGEQRIACVTESVENGPGLRARWTVTIENRHAFTELFELAEPGEDFVLLFTNRWRRTANAVRPF